MNKLWRWQYGRIQRMTGYWKYHALSNWIMYPVFHLFAWLSGWNLGKYYDEVLAIMQATDKICDELTSGSACSIR